MNKTALLTLLSILATWTVQQQPAEALILNLGADVHWDPSYSTTSFFAGDDTGNRLYGGNELTLTLDTAAIFGGYTIESATLFVDAFDFDPADLSDVLVQGGSVGALTDTDAPASFIPLVGGGTIVTPTWDVDNTFFAFTLAQAGALSTSHAYTITFKNLSGDNGRDRSFRIDGINIQAVHNPEPASMALFGLGGLAAAFGRRKWWSKA